MARQLRIEYPGAFYHVFSRGNQKRPIFLSDADRNFFLHCLRKTHKKFGVIVHVYCLMPNHFHMILETPLGNLSRVMHLLITNYTIYFNKKHKRVGHLFQGRFKSVLIEAVSYAKELSRYIHLNPVRSHIVERPEEFVWSSYGYYQGRIRPEGWLETSVVLRLFGDQLRKSIKSHEEFVLRGIGMEASPSIKDSFRSGILGSDEFIARIKREYLKDDISKSDREKPQIRKLLKKPDLSRIMSIAKKVLGPQNRLLVPVAIFISHKCTPARLEEIGEFFSMSVSGVSNASSRAKAAISRNPPLAKAAQDIEREVTSAEAEMLDRKELLDERVKPTFYTKNG